MRVFVTGASGFVGHRFCQMAKCIGHDVTAQYRSICTDRITKDFTVTGIDSKTDWSGAFKQIDCIVHCAARVHQMNETKAQSRAHYHEVNALGTINLARQAAEQGVKRFVFLSSIKVNGESTLEGQKFLPEIAPKPADAYGASKWDAEVGLRKVAEETGLEVVIIRPPLVYGPGVKANFHSLLQWIDKGIPLPLGAINNKRSMVHLDNLVDLMLICCSNPRAAGNVFMVSDDNDVSTSELLKQVAHSMKKPNRMIPIPETWLKFASSVLGKKDVGQRLCSSLQVDLSSTKRALDWTPPVPFERGIQETVDAYLANKS
ncbi:UDP-glucose 4-epimerase family protein [Vibrio superstes]|uniref:UDP-glucose 4-epimerase n=1 Tax=Vibrio superstes NBRC 103154 TaxID=1219062 RepID=A0A511QWB4_9VIBR|nr:SDR family oxidoreductase [Vibrio superstes]GEM80862.1 UDP-glucose 4-epimerase [Vibrio superstes NBRC 103154]